MSVIIPAHDEEAVVGRLLQALVETDRDSALEIVVVANGCSDNTVAVASAVAPSIRVVEIAEASKIAALNAGDAAATSFPRAYVDADVVITVDTLFALADSLEAPNGPLVASPRLVVDLEGTTWFLRAHYRVWELSDYRLEGHIGSGVYAVSREGRARFGAFPDVIADDRFVQQRFAPEERATLMDHAFTVCAPRTLRAHMRRATRIALGNQQLPDALQHTPQPAASQRYGSLAARVLRQPRLWPAFVVYCVGYANPQVRARWRTLRGKNTAWNRDETSRVVTFPR
jgi:glycosyltransferase involved in cell wall biosynthesis